MACDMHPLSVEYEINRGVATFHDLFFVGTQSRFSKLNNFTNNTIHYLKLYPTMACDKYQLVVKYEMTRSAARYRDSIFVKIKS
jgi:hypothetical protein